MRGNNWASYPRPKRSAWPRRKGSTSWRSRRPQSRRSAILDYGQYKYELQKREREAKKKQKAQTFKEIRLRVKIDVNDLRTKLRRAGEFLDDGDRVKVTVQFRGREMT